MGSSICARPGTTEHRAAALVERHVHQGLDLHYFSVALHHVLDSDVLVGDRVKLPDFPPGIRAQCDGVQVLLCGPPAGPGGPPILGMKCSTSSR